MRLDDLLHTIAPLAPQSLAEPWDKVGLHVGDRDQGVNRALLCIDLTQRVMAEAVAAKTQLVVAYHPPIFKPIDRLTADEARSRTLMEAIRHGVAIYSPHTALDAAEGGVNDWLCDALGKGTCKPIRPALSCGTTGCKLVTFVPHDHADAVRAALSRAGAGVIGNYTECSFGVAGEGTFRGGEGSSPRVGQRGRFERVPELRLEMICPQDRIAAAVEALRQTHPYEEPAFDICPREAAPPVTTTGQGRVVTLDKAISLPELVRRIKRHLGVRHLEVGSPGSARRIRKVGLCAGAGGSLLDEAGEIDAFFTGEMRHHDVLAAVERGMAVVLAGRSSGA